MGRFLQRKRGKAACSVQAKCYNNRKETAKEETRMDQLDRIRQMEQILNEVTLAVQNLMDSVDRFDAAVPKLRVLAAYYESEQWRMDYDDDAAGKLPEELRRGVLAQDTVYDLLTDVNRLRQKLLSLCERLRPQAE